MSKTEQTSVEWLSKQISSSKYFYKLMEDINSRSTIAQSDIIEQAKAMHKEEICQFVSDYLDDADYGMTAEEYYDQIYGGNNG